MLWLDFANLKIALFALPMRIVAIWIRKRELEAHARNYTIRILQLPIETTRHAPISYKSRVTQFD